MCVWVGGGGIRKENRRGIPKENWCRKGDGGGGGREGGGLEGE